MPSNSQQKKGPSDLFGCGLERRVWTLRILFVATMLLTAAVFGVLAYTISTNFEKNTARHTYESVVTSALEEAQAITKRKQQGADSLTSALSFAFPSASQWPLVGLRGFTSLATKVAKLSSTAGHGMSVVVRPEQVKEFEAHAQQLFENFTYPESAGYSEFGFGIFGEDPARTNATDQRFHDISGMTVWDNKYEMMLPFLQHKNTLTNPGLLMRNVYQLPARGVIIDSIIDCSLQAAADMDDSTAEQSSPPCGAITDFLEIYVRPGPSAVFYDPIFPADDPMTVVGLIGTSLNFEEVLTNIVPSFVSGLDCVISNGEVSHTYVISKGKPSLVGAGDLHAGWDTWARPIVLNDFVTGVTASVSYTLTFYPTQELFDEFSSDIPLYAAVGFTTVIVLCTFIFFLYDYFMQYEAHQRKKILQVKRRFVRTVGHEIRTPLNVVCMGLDMLMEDLRENRPSCLSCGGNDQEVQPAQTSADGKPLLESMFTLVRDIHENSQNAVTVLNDLLNYDKVESGTFELEFARVPIFASIEKTIAEFSIQSKNRDMRIHCKKVRNRLREMSSTDVEENQIPDFASKFVWGDERRLNLVVRNLISNALKFCEGKDVTVELSHVPNEVPHLPSSTPKKSQREESKELTRRKATSEAAGLFCMKVIDQGVGLTKDQLDRLFDEGVQFNPEVLQHGGGSGLGLCIAKEIVKQHHGTIHAASNGMGHGTTFSLKLPLFSCSTEEVVASVVAENVMSDAQTKPATRHVLVVDDVATNTKMLVRLLERAGHTCITASNGQQAVNLFLAKQESTSTEDGIRNVDTVLMDYEMPEMNGPDATKKLRELGCKAVILGVTGNVLAEDVATFKAAGADSVLFKPINLLALQSAWDSARKHR